MRYLNCIIILSEKHIKLAKQYILTNITKNYVKSGENIPQSFLVQLKCIKTPFIGNLKEVTLVRIKFGMPY